jgi:magnesium chelatase subunit I
MNVREGDRMDRPQSLGALRADGYHGRSVRDEVRGNLLRKLESGEPLFEGVLGYDDTVVPQLVNAILARQNFILLGLRGQAKSRIVRQLAGLLDEALPIIAGSEVNDDPFRPISKYGRQKLEEMGDETPITWIGRDARYIEKLATPDVTIADMIGDLDPIRAARGGHVLADELTIHFGLLPRANRGIFAVNELPDLASRIQVGLFNIMQEGDVQIKGYPVRLPLDVFLVFTANPEDYTARGKIITPLKDRIGAEVNTHYPAEVEDGIAITRQEAWLDRGWRPVHVPAYIMELVERVAFLARGDQRIDQRSGVSQRLPISVIENAVSNAERRAVALHEKRVVPRVSDVHAAIPAITGKLELEYEGELQGAAKIARDLISQAALETFESRRTAPVDDALDEVVDYFDRGGVLQMADLSSDKALLEGLSAVPSLLAVVDTMDLGDETVPVRGGAAELVLESLVAEKRISRAEGGRFGRGPRGASGLG